MESAGFFTPLKYGTVYAKDLDFQGQGEFQVDFLNIEHSIGLDLQSEMILKGYYDEKYKWYNHSLFSMKEQEGYNNKRVVVHEISHNIFVASTQFSKPFDYSTSNWDEKNDCNKDISKFRSLQRQHNDDGQPITMSATRTKNADPNERFNYSIMSNQYDPRIRFYVPGKT